MQFFVRRKYNIPYLPSLVPLEKSWKLRYSIQFIGILYKRKSDANCVKPNCWYAYNHFFLFFLFLFLFFQWDVMRSISLENINSAKSVTVNFTKSHFFALNWIYFYNVWIIFLKGIHLNFVIKFLVVSEFVVTGFYCIIFLTIPGLKRTHESKAIQFIWISDIMKSVACYQIQPNCIYAYGQIYSIQRSIWTLMWKKRKYNISYHLLVSIKILEL